MITSLRHAAVEEVCNGYEARLDRGCCNVHTCRFIDLLSYLFSANVGTLGTNTLSHGYGRSEKDLRSTSCMGGLTYG